jgi:hypothetical protein
VVDSLSEAPDNSDPPWAPDTGRHFESKILLDECLAQCDYMGHGNIDLTQKDCGLGKSAWTRPREPEPVSAATENAEKVEAF